MKPAYLTKDGQSRLDTTVAVSRQRGRTTIRKTTGGVATFLAKSDTLDGTTIYTTFDDSTGKSGMCGYAIYAGIDLCLYIWYKIWEQPENFALSVHCRPFSASSENSWD